MDEIYKKRLTSSTKILNDFYKKMLNSLYGRFGLVYNKTEYNINNKEIIVKAILLELGANEKILS